MSSTFSLSSISSAEHKAVRPTTKPFQDFAGQFLPFAVESHENYAALPLVYPSHKGVAADNVCHVLCSSPKERFQDTTKHFSSSHMSLHLCVAPVASRQIICVIDRVIQKAVPLAFGLLLH